MIRQSEGGHLQYFEWDALGRLIRSKNDKAETHYRYDALGRRIEKQKQYSQAGRNHYTETTAYGWDGDTLAYESTNLYTKHYVYEKGSFVPLIQATYRQQLNQHQTPEWANGYDYDKDPLWHTEQKANAFDRVWFYHCDHLGTPQEMSDQTGAIVWTANYKAWGECKTENHTKRDIWDSEIITNNIRFQGQYYDNETGLHYNRHRYYSPYVGRFISKDPIGLLGGNNIYAYAPNPVGWIDPLGLKKKVINTGQTSCGAKGMKAFQDHHIISDKNKATMNHPLLKAAGGTSLLQNSKNKIDLPTDPSHHPTKSIHCGKHDNVVSRYLADKMTATHRYGVQNNWTQAQFKEGLFKIMDDERLLLDTGVRALNVNRRAWAIPLPNQM